MGQRKSFIICLIVLLAILPRTAYANIQVVASAAEALINDSTFLNCSTSSDSVEWLFFPNHYQHYFIYSHGTVNLEYTDRFRIEVYTDSIWNHFNLILQSVAKDDAGRYICRDPDNINEEGKEVHLIVLESEPNCRADWNAKGVIGSNSCEIEPEAVQLSCSVPYSGEKAPSLTWMKVGEYISIKSPSVNCSDSGHTYTCNLTTRADLQMDGSSYICQTTGSTTKQYSCTSQAIKIIYAIGEYFETNATVNQKANCFVNSSQPCDYIWKHNNSVYYGQDIDLTSPGSYICEAICPMRDKNCTITVKKVLASSPYVTQQNVTQQNVAQIVVPVVVCSVLVLSIIVSIVIYKKRDVICKKCKKERREQQSSKGPDIPQREQQEPPQRDASPEGVVLLRAEDAGESSGRQDPPEINPESHDVLYVRGAVAENIFQKKFTLMEGKIHDKKVRGLTVLEDDLFVAFEKSSIIEVFPVKSDMSSHISVVVAELEDPGTIAACAKHSCLYVMDQISNSKKKIFRVKPDGTKINKWETDDDDKGRISVNRDGNIVMTAYNKGKVKIYSPDGTLLTEKTIDFSGTNITYIFHAINLADGNFIIGHGMYSSDVHQVLKIDATGNVLRSFGDKHGSGDAQLNCPAYVAERNDGSILVADQDNHRIIKLNSELEFVDVLFTKENCGVSRPRVMFVYEKTEHALLFLGCNETSTSGGYVLVLRLSQ